MKYTTRPSPALVATEVDQDNVCIGDNNNQEFLDANLKKLVTGLLPQSSSSCYTESNAPTAPTVCGARPDGNGLFSPAGCPTQACKKPKKEKKTKP